MKIWEMVKGMVKHQAAKAADTLRYGREYKSIFDLEGVPPFRQFYDTGIAIWKALYKGMHKPWHVIAAPTIQDPGNKREMARMGMPKAVCAEMASLLWSEKCEINVTRKGAAASEGEGAVDDRLQRFINRVLADNGFQTKMQEAIEQCIALGGEAIKVWCEGQPDASGNIVPGTEKIKLGYCMADQFIPTSWDNAGVDEGIFVSRKAKNGHYYTRLEWHGWKGDTYTIRNELYKADVQPSGENQDILGFFYPLAEIYPNLSPETEIKDLRKSLFSYFKPPIANNLDDNSPLGISAYANAMDTMRALDICYDSFVREFRLGRRRIIVPARCMRTVVDPVTGLPRRYFDATDEAYEALATDTPDDLKVSDNTVSLRVDEHVEAINAFLSILCLQVGFSASTFSFDHTANGGIKTATEVVSENSKTYKTVKCYQNIIHPALVQLIDNILRLAELYDISFEGEKVSALAASGYEVAISWDDGITQDRQTNIKEGLTLIAGGVMSKKRFLTDAKYGQGMTEAEARAEIEAIKAEQTIDVGTATSIFSSLGG